MFVSSNLQSNVIEFNGGNEPYILFKIDISGSNTHLIEVSDFINTISWNHKLLLLIEYIITERQHVLSSKRTLKLINNKYAESKIKLHRVSKQSPTTVEFAVIGFQLGYSIAELLNELLNKGAFSPEMTNLLTKFNVHPEMIEAISEELYLMVRRLRPINQFITVYHALKLM